MATTYPEHLRPLLLQVPVLFRSRVQALPEPVGFVPRGIGVYDGELRCGRGGAVFPGRRGRRSGRRSVSSAAVASLSPPSTRSERRVEHGRNRQDADVLRVLYLFLKQVVDEEVVGLLCAAGGQARGVDSQVEVHERGEWRSLSRGGAELVGRTSRRRARCLRCRLLGQEAGGVPHRRVGDDRRRRPHEDRRGRRGAAASLSAAGTRARGRGRGDADAAGPPALDDDLLDPRVEDDPAPELLYPAHEGVDDGPGAPDRIVEGGADIGRRRSRRRTSRRRGRGGGGRTGRGRGARGRRGVPLVEHVRHLGANRVLGGHAAEDCLFVCFAEGGRGGESRERKERKGGGGLGLRRKSL